MNALTAAEQFNQLLNQHCKFDRGTARFSAAIDREFQKLWKKLNPTQQAWYRENWATRGYTIDDTGRVTFDAAKIEHPDREVVTVSGIKCCARCGKDHTRILAFTRMERPIRNMTHWSPCPTNGDPILVRVEQENGAAPVSGGFKCPTCEQVFPYKSYYRRHVQRSHGGDKALMEFYSDKA